MPFCALQPETVLPDLGNQIELSFFKGNLCHHLSPSTSYISYPADFSIQSKEPTPSASMAIQKKLQGRKYYLSGWYPQIIHFNRVFHYKPSILGYPYFWKHLSGPGVEQQLSQLIFFFRMFFFGQKQEDPK